MKKVILTIALVSSLITQAQISFSAGGFIGNQDNDNPITSQDLSQWDNYKPGVAFGEWMSEEQLNEFSDRTDGVLIGYNVAIGLQLPLVKYTIQEDDMSAGISTSAQIFIQDENTNYWDWNASYSAGIYVDFGFRLDVGIQNYFNNDWGKYVDISTNLINDTVGIFVRYQTGNPFTNKIESVFIDGTGITKETLTAGIRINL